MLLEIVEEGLLVMVPVLAVAGECSLVSMD